MEERGVEVCLGEDSEPSVDVSLEGEAGGEVEIVIPIPPGIAGEDHVDADGLEELTHGFRDGADERVEGEEFARKGTGPLLCLASARSARQTYAELQRQNTEAPHDKESTPLLIFFPVRRPARENLITEPRTVDDAGAQELQDEVEGFLEPIVDFGSLASGVHSLAHDIVGSIWVEEAESQPNSKKSVKDLPSDIQESPHDIRHDLILLLYRPRLDPHRRVQRRQTQLHVYGGRLLSAQFPLDDVKGDGPVALFDEVMREDVGEGDGDAASGRVGGIKVVVGRYAAHFPVWVETLREEGEGGAPGRGMTLRDDVLDEAVVLWTIGERLRLDDETARQPSEDLG